MKDRIVKIPRSASGMRLSEWLNQEGYAYSAPCGGRGVCGKCRVKLLDGRLMSRTSPKTSLVPDGDGWVLACKALCAQEGAVILLPCEEEQTLLSHDTPVGQASTASKAGKERETTPSACSETALCDCGVALDIGTTTLAAALVRKDAGEVLATASCLNPQSGFGADVMSRIDACGKGHLGQMQYLLLQSVLRLIEALTEDFPENTLSEMTVAGNPTMLHIFCGVSPVGMGVYPFTPAFLGTQRLRGAALGLPVERVTVLPSASAFIGSDVLGGALVCAVADCDSPTLFADFGTNGEMLLCCGKKKGGRLIATAAAAGPALEGAGISCGMGGVDGAVCEVKAPAEEDAVVFRTVGDQAPRGICGSGLVDFAAHLLMSGSMDETGLLVNKQARLRGRHRTHKGLGSAVSTPIVLTESDIRQLQLAKGALRAGLETLLEHAGIKHSEVSRMMLAGGLGFHIDPQSAARIGLLPQDMVSSVEVVGNTALAGAIRCLADPDAVEQMEAIAQNCETLELNSSPHFAETFVAHMLFPKI